MRETEYDTRSGAARHDERMEVGSNETVRRLRELGVEVDGPRRTRRSPAALLRALGAEQTGQPFREVEVTDRCAECGNPHGALRFSTLGAAEPVRWVGDATSIEGIAVAAAGKVRGIAAVLWTTQVAPAAYIDDAAFHPDELAELSAVPHSERDLARARHLIRKGALVRLAGHFDNLEPALVSVSLAAEARVLRAVPQLGGAWRDIRILDLDAGPGMVGAIAVLP
ncbi:MAG TPA: hypothetical protein VFU07_03615 [Candidatus Lumbricidophila sp.]|nr:hypothetical protein [Candidatus Lumbricidophila sp.]